MSTITAVRVPQSSTASRTKNSILVAAGTSLCFLSIGALHIIVRVYFILAILKSHRGSIGIISGYGVSLLVGSFLPDYFNSWILFLVTIGMSSMFTIIFPRSLSFLYMFIMVSLDNIAWLAAAKLIKQITPPSQQQVWWIVLTACTSINLIDVMKVITSGDILLVGFGVTTCTLLLMLTLTAAYYMYDERLRKNNEAAINCHWCNFWSIIALNSVLWNAKFLILIHWDSIGNTIFSIIDETFMNLGGEVGIIVIGSLSTWLTHKQLMQRETLFKIILSTLPMLLLALKVLLSDYDNQHRTQVSLLVFFVGFAIDGLMVLTNWRIMEIVPERISGRALGLTAILPPLGAMILGIVIQVLLEQGTVPVTMVLLLIAQSLLPL